MSGTALYKSAVLALGAFAGYFWGALDGFFYALITFVIVDYVTGVMSAAVHKKLSSNIGFKGIIKKICVFIMIGMAHIIDTYMLNGSDVLRTMIIFFFMANEGLSIVENVIFMGVKVPDQLVAVLQQLKKKGEGEEKPQKEEESDGKKHDEQQS